MHVVALPEKDDLVKELRQLLNGLNRQDRRIARWPFWSQRRATIPADQLQERAVQITQWLMTLPSPPLR